MMVSRIRFIRRKSLSIGLTIRGFHQPFSVDSFPRQTGSFRQEGNQVFQIDVALERRLMILSRPDAILHVTAKGAWSNRAQPFFVIKERQVLLDLNMSKVMPVTDQWRIKLFQ